VPRAKFVIEHSPKKSFRVEMICSSYGMSGGKTETEYDVDIPIETMPKWNVGLITGPSGSGKTIIAKKMFPDYTICSGFAWGEGSILDDFEESLSTQKIQEVLSSVGFSSPPDWIKPFSILSTGQQMRAEIARLLSSSQGPSIYDEFTATIDRTTAQIGCIAVQKFVRREDKKFIAISCHDDVEGYLQPDWVYDTHLGKFRTRCLQRPDITVAVRTADYREWGIFRRFHYLTSSHSRSAHCYIAEIGGRPIAWCSVIHLLHATAKKTKMIHRLVVRPDYQGVGIGTKFLTIIAKRYVEQGYRVRLVTSSAALLRMTRRADDGGRSCGFVLARRPGYTSRRFRDNDRTKPVQTSPGRLTISMEATRSSLDRYFAGAKGAATGGGQ